MATLEEIVKDSWIKGITPDGLVKIERAEMIGSDSLEVFYSDEKGGMGKAVWERRYGKGGMGKAVWERRYGKGGMGKAVWERRYGKGGMGKAVWERRYGKGGMGKAVWERRYGKGGMGKALLSRDQENKLSLETKARSFSFDANGEHFKLASEAYRIRIAVVVAT